MVFVLFVNIGVKLQTWICWSWKRSRLHGQHRLPWRCTPVKFGLNLKYPCLHQIQLCSLPPVFFSNNGRRKLKFPSGIFYLFNFLQFLCEVFSHTFWKGFICRRIMSFLEVPNKDHLADFQLALHHYNVCSVYKWCCLHLRPCCLHPELLARLPAKDWHDAKCVVHWSFAGSRIVLLHFLHWARAAQRHREHQQQHQVFFHAISLMLFERHKAENLQSYPLSILSFFFFFSYMRLASTATTGYTTS